MLMWLWMSILFIGSANPMDLSYYEILGISKQADTQEIKQAYKKLAIKLHPDKNPDKKKQEQFLKITEAYETLRDPEKRRKYDIYGTFQTYTGKYNYQSESEYNNLFYNGLYYKDPFVDTVSGNLFYNYLSEGFHFINFYSPFCPPCQNLVDHWKRLAEVFKGIVKVGAINCKYHSSFCYNSMRIGSYPTLLFYPNGKYGNYVQYRNAHSYEALEQFVMSYVNSRIHVPVVTHIKTTDKPIAYVLGENRIEKDALTRISFRLNGLVTLAIVDDDDLREKLTQNEETTVVFKYKNLVKEIDATFENEVLQEIVDALPKIPLVEPDKLKSIRNDLRKGSETPWVLYLSKEGDDKLLLYQMQSHFSNMNFGVINCEKWSEMCLSLQVETTPTWAVLKIGGVYQKALSDVDIQSFIHTAITATNLHTLSASELNTILRGEMGVWVLLMVPDAVSREQTADQFMKTSLHFKHDEHIEFGIVECGSGGGNRRGRDGERGDACSEVERTRAALVVVRDEAGTHTYSGALDRRHLVEFITLLKDSEDLNLNEQRVLEIMDPASREQNWLVAFMPASCGRACDSLMHEWRIVANKFRGLDFVRVGVLQCNTGDSGLCNNVRSPTARLYLYASGLHYSVSLQNLSQAPYILEWAIQYIDDAIQKLNWHVFTKNVIAEEFNPSTNKKPWLVYFHSPRCYRCYEMFADFAIAGILLKNAVQLGKVNCINERSLCQHEQIMTYPSIKLYLSRNQHQSFSSVISIQVKDYTGLLNDITPHLRKYHRNEHLDVTRFGFKHDEL